MTRSLPSRDGESVSRQNPSQPKIGRSPGTRRGRHSRRSRLRSLQAALRKINSAWELSQSPLAKYRDLQALGRTQFADRAFPEGWAVQAVLRLACTRVAGALDPRKGEFLQRWVAGESIASIAASTGMSRSHVSRRWRPQVLAALDATRTRTARRPLAPQGFVRLPQSSVLFPSVTALTGAKSDAKASAQRPAKSRPSVANWRHLYCIPRHWIRERVRRGRMEGLCQLTKPHADATCGPARCPFSGLAQRRLLSHHQASTSLPLLLAMRAAAV